MKLICFLLIVSRVICTADTPPPVWTGSTSPDIGTFLNYTFDDGNVYALANFYCPNARVVSVSRSGTTYTAQLEWIAAGSTTINFRNDDLIVTGGSYAVTVASVTPPTPTATSFSYVQSCGSTTLTKGGTPGTYAFVWYYQTSASGTSTTMGNTATTSGTIYLRARTASAPFVWSTSSQNLGSVTVLAPIAAPEISSDSSARYRIGDGAVTLNVAAVAGASSYRWYEQTLGGTAITGAAGATYSTIVNATKSFYVESVRSGSYGECVSPARRKVTTYIYPRPTVSITNGGESVMGETVTMSVENPSFDSYQWKRNGAAILGKTSTSYSTAVHGNYTIQVTKNGLTGESSQLGVTNGFNFIPLNFVVENTALVAGVKDAQEMDQLTVEQRMQNVEYRDDFGRPMQSVITQGSPDKEDIIQPVGYDEYGRQNKTYLPFVAENTGKFKLHAVKGENGEYENSTQQIFYDQATDQDLAFAETIFDDSPLNEVIKQGSPGDAWQPDTVNNYNSGDHAVKIARGFNLTDEVIKWTFMPPTGEWGLGLVDAGSHAETLEYYAPNQLTKELVKDEEGNESITYTDKNGKVILKRVQATNQNLVNNINYASTYYVYDRYQNLVCVIPPEGVKSMATDYHPVNATLRERFLNNWAFRYRYDSRKRMTHKKIPSAGTVFIVYDSLNRLVATQDSVQRSSANKHWTFTKYDLLNRPVLSGMKELPLMSQPAMQQLVNDYYSEHSEKMFDKFVGSRTSGVHGYSNESFPVYPGAGETSDASRYLSVTYYDNYRFLTLIPTGNRYSFKANHLTGQETSKSERVSGQVTGTKIKMLDGGVTGGHTWLTTVNYYDDDYRLIQAVSDNYKGGIDRTTNIYDFTGKILKTQTTHEEFDVSWEVLTGSYVFGNTLKRNFSGNSWGSSGAYSKQQLSANTDGWVEARMPDIATRKGFGFATSNPDAHYSSMEYCFVQYFGTLYIIEAGVTKKTYNNLLTPGDLIRIDRTGSAISYMLNDSLLWSHSVATRPALKVDVTFYTGGSTLLATSASFAGHTHAVKRSFVYDHAGRILKIWHSLDALDSVVLVDNTYNILGQLVDKKLHSDDGDNFKQSVDYEYNIRGWLTKINDSKLVAQDEDAERDLFGMELGYNDDLGVGTGGLYNGNISAIKWSKNQALDSQRKDLGYGYTYDKMNRIKSSVFKESLGTEWTLPGNNANQETGFEYDLNGNLTRLKRNDRRASGWMDDLTYDYGSGTEKSNKLMKVTDAADKTRGFVDGAFSTEDYRYDNNGNLLWDRNKGGVETLTNGSFDNGSSNWTLTNSGRLTFTNGELQIAAGAAVSTLKQTVVTASRPYVIQIDMERSAGTVTLYAGNVATTAFNSTGVHTVSITAAGGSDFTITPSATFVGKIKSVSLKGVTVITYNFLNLPELVTRPGDKQLQYFYDASGRKVRQEVSKNQVLEKSTDYAGEYIYENDTLKFINHEEGRILPGIAAEYQYHLKDHLGNVRTTFTTKEEIDTAVATMETANVTEEASGFLYYDEAVKINSAIFDHTNSGATHYALRLTGLPNQQYGLAKSISVMPGDVVRASVYAKYLESDTTEWNPGAFATFMNSVRWGNPGSGVLVDGGLTGTTGGIIPPFGALLTKGTGNEDGAPKAYLNYVLYDREFNFKDGGFIAVTTDAREYGQDGGHEELFKELNIKEAGYVYLYLSNDNVALGGDVIEVFFDDFTVEHMKSPVIQQDDYYAFGLNFNSYSRENATSNQYLYNGKEKQDELDLGWLDFGARMYQADLGRFFVQDRFAEKYLNYTPYHYGANNPILYVDVNGDSLDLSNLSEAQMKTYQDNLKLLMESKMFASYYNSLVESETVYKVSAGKGKEGTPQEAGQFFNPETNEIGLGEDVGAGIMAQEMFHAYQGDGKFYEGDSPTPSSTIETEGDIATYYVMSEAGLPTSVYGEWGNEFLMDSYNGPPTAEKVQSAEYQQMFQTAVDNRIKYYKGTGLNVPTYTAPNTGVKPKALEALVKSLKK